MWDSSIVTKSVGWSFPLCCAHDGYNMRGDAITSKDLPYHYQCHQKRYGCHCRFFFIAFQYTAHLCPSIVKIWLMRPPPCSSLWISSTPDVMWCTGITKDIMWWLLFSSLIATTFSPRCKKKKKWWAEDIGKSFHEVNGWFIDLTAACWFWLDSHIIKLLYYSALYIHRTSVPDFTVA